jgi:hypothetical protein
MPAILVCWTTADGEEREEQWPSLERFRAWAQAEGVTCAWRAYAEAEDGEWELTDEGRIGGVSRPGPRPG